MPRALTVLPLLAVTLSGCDLVQSLLEPAEVAQARVHLDAHEYSSATPLLSEALKSDAENAELRELAVYSNGLATTQGLADLGRWCGGAAVPAIQEEARAGMLRVGVTSNSWPEALTVLHGAATRGHNRDLTGMTSVDLRAAKATFAGCLVAFGDDAGKTYLEENLKDAWGAEQDVLSQIGLAADSFLKGILGQEGHSATVAATDLLKLAGLSDLFGLLSTEGEVSSGHAALQAELTAVKPSWASFADSPCAASSGLPLTSREWTAQEIDGLRNQHASRPDLQVYPSDQGTVAFFTGQRGDDAVVRAVRWSGDTWSDVDLGADHAGHRFAGACTASTLPEGQAMPFGTLTGKQVAVRWYTGAKTITSGGGGYYGKKKVTKKPGWEWQVVDL